jgi:hypothetical protein
MNEQQSALCLAFEALERDNQMDALQKDGVYIGKVRAGKGVKLLYQYQSIYVEVIYTIYRSHVTAVHCFTDTGILDLYLSSSDFDAFDNG